jgi:hypothetical protein
MWRLSIVVENKIGLTVAVEVSCRGVVPSAGKLARRQERSVAPAQQENRRRIRRANPGGDQVNFAIAVKVHGELRESHIGKVSWRLEITAASV